MVGWFLQSSALSSNRSPHLQGAAVDISIPHNDLGELLPFFGCRRKVEMSYKPDLRTSPFPCPGMCLERHGAAMGAHLLRGEANPRQRGPFPTVDAEERPPISITTFPKWDISTSRWRNALIAGTYRVQKVATAPCLVYRDQVDPLTACQSRHVQAPQFYDALSSVASLFRPPVKTQPTGSDNLPRRPNSQVHTNWPLLRHLAPSPQKSSARSVIRLRITSFRLGRPHRRSAPTSHCASTRCVTSCSLDRTRRPQHS